MLPYSWEFRHNDAYSIFWREHSGHSLIGIAFYTKVKCKSIQVCRWTLGMKGKRHKSLRTRPRTADASEMKDGILSREERLRAFRLCTYVSNSGFRSWNCELDILEMVTGLLQNLRLQDCRVFGADMLLAGARSIILWRARFGQRSLSWT
jgi:hypothetical protein